MDVLAVIHGEAVRSGVFGEVVKERGHRLEEWSFAWGTPPAQPLDSYGAVLVFGGAMHADQDDQHPWLRDEDAFLQELLRDRIPLLGVCLGVQLLAKAAGAGVFRVNPPEIGWYDVQLTEAAEKDALFSRLPPRFEAFQWHYYSYGLPGGATELARSERYTQAFRLGESAWGIQFHAELTQAQIEGWIERPDDPEDVLHTPADLREQTDERIGRWNELGRELCGAFLDVAEDVAAVAA
jgi:GMP synthase (glutamine-hydrolysing)